MQSQALQWSGSGMHRQPSGKCGRTVAASAGKQNIFCLLANIRVQEPNFVSERLALLLRILEVLGSNLGPAQISTDAFVVFLNPFWKVPGLILN